MRTIDSGKLELLQIFFKFIFIVLDQVQIVVACREDLPISLTAFLVTIELLLGLIVAAVSISTDWSFFSRDHLLLLLVILKGDLNSTQVVHHLWACIGETKVIAIIFRVFSVLLCSLRLLLLLDIDRGRNDPIGGDKELLLSPWIKVLSLCCTSGPSNGIKVGLLLVEVSLSVVLFGIMSRLFQLFCTTVVISLLSSYHLFFRGHVSFSVGRFAIGLGHASLWWVEI